MASDAMKIAGLALIALLVGSTFYFTDLIPVDVLVENALFVSFAGVVLLATYWAVLEREDGESTAETLRKVGGRAEEGTNGALTAGRVALVSIFGVAATASDQILALLTELLGTTEPMTLASLATTALGAIGLSGIVEVTAMQFVGVALVMIALATLAGRNPWVA